MNCLEGLKQIRALIDKGWTQGDFARDRNGQGVSSTSPDAVCWCLFGAIKRATIDCPVVFDQTNAAIYRQITKKSKANNIPAFNDKIAKNQFDVLDVIDEAIKAEQSNAPDSLSNYACFRAPTPSQAPPYALYPPSLSSS